MPVAGKYYGALRILQVIVAQTIRSYTFSYSIVAIKRTMDVQI